MLGVVLLITNYREQRLDQIGRWWLVEEVTTSRHRSLCLECNSAALPKETPCPHPHTCANCKEAHMATDASCPRRKKYARPPSPDAPVTQGPNDDQVPMAEDGN